MNSKPNVLSKIWGSNQGYKVWAIWTIFHNSIDSKSMLISQYWIKEYISIGSKLVGGQKSNLHSVAKSLPIQRIWYAEINPKRESGLQLYTI